MTRVRLASDEDASAKHRPQNRAESKSKLRRDGRHCPVCLAALPRIAGKGRVARKCTICGGQPQLGKRCSRCQQEAIWETDSKAACQACSQHGSRLRVVAGSLE
jgi:hypothetical protein